MNTPEVTALSAEQITQSIRDKGGCFSHAHWALKAIAERDERVRELENQIAANQWVSGDVALKSRAVSGDDREELVALFMKQVQREPTRIRLNPKPTIAELEANLNSDNPRKLDLNADGNVYEIVPAPKLTVSILIDQILAAGFRRAEESSEADGDGELAQEHRLYGNPDASPAEPVKVAGRKALAKWYDEFLGPCIGAPEALERIRARRDIAKYTFADALLASGILNGRKLDEVKVFAMLTGVYTKWYADGDKWTKDPPLLTLVHALCADTADIWMEE